ncbi:MAG: outer membrane protein assembly factor BamA [Ignavibacteria bacterium]|nr:outer membrane protein assembly factor BamA [Ignavibacteria bacterium]
MRILSRNYFLNVIFLLLLFLFSLAAQTAPKTYKILGVSVEGNTSADARTIVANSGLKIGDEIQIPGDQTIGAIKQLWSLNIFSNVEILIEKELADGAFLLIKVEEFPRIEKAVVEGNDEISTSKIEEKINFIRGQILKTYEVQKVKLKIMKLYEEDGYFNAQITPKFFQFFQADTSDDKIITHWRNKKDLSEEYNLEFDKDDKTYTNLIDKIKDRVLLKYDIIENDVTKVRKITFKGNNELSESDLKGAFKETEESKWWKFWSSSKFDKNKYEEDKKLLQKHYLKNGYRDAEVISDSLVYSNDKKNLEIILNVYEGPKYKVRNITWEGNTIYTADALNERLGFHKGDVFDYELFNQNLRGNEKQTDVAALYLDNGYLTFNMKTDETKVSADSIDINIQVSERNQFKIGKVEIYGNDKTKDKVVRRELYTIPGDYFNRAYMFRSLQQLANLQFFNVEKLYQEGVDYQLANDSTVDVAFKVEEKSSDYLNASVGYSGSYGFSGSVGITLTNFSMAEPFQLGGGQVLSFNWQFGVGNLYRTFSLGFTEPWLYDTPTLVGLDFFDTRQQYIYDLRQSGASVRVGRRLKWPDDYFYTQGTFKYQSNNVINGGSYYREGKTQQFTLGASISRKNVDNPIFPSIGSSVGLDAEISGGPFLPGDVDYYKINFKAEWYKRLFGTSRFVLFSSADLGYLEELKKETPIQPFEYFYMGGNGLIIATTPLRGYEDRSIGPINKVGEVYGGKVSLRYNAELRFAVALEPIPLYLLTFAEAGNVFESIDATQAFNLRRSVGIGARIMINPIGLIGFDLGYGFDRKAVDGKDPSWVFHFQFGKGF